jgi:hypothetical protein
MTTYNILRGLASMVFYGLYAVNIIYCTFLFAHEQYPKAIFLLVASICVDTVWCIITSAIDGYRSKKWVDEIQFGDKKQNK